MLKSGKKGALYIWNGQVSPLSSEPCTIAGNTAQITNSAKRLLSPNHTQQFTDTGGAVVISINYLTGTATFATAPTSVTVTGSYIPTTQISTGMQLYNWKLDIAVALHDGTAFQSDWKNYGAGLSDWKGSIDGYWYDQTFFNALTQAQVGGVSIIQWLLRLYLDLPNTLYYEGFANINGLSDSVPVSDLVKETITFTGNGPLYYMTS